MAKIYQFDQYKKPERHLENQDVFDNAKEISLAEGAISWTKKTVNRISNWMTSFNNETKAYNAIPKNRIERARDLLEKWKYENRLNLKIRKDLSEQIEIDENWLRIWELYWEFSYIFLDSLEKWEKYLKKFKLKIPTIDEIDHCALLLPWKSIEEKRMNLLNLLGFHINDNWNCKLWTSTKNESQEMDDELWLDSNVLEIAHVFRTRISNFFKDTDSCNLLYFYWTWINYYEASKNEVWNICWTRKIQ